MHFRKTAALLLAACAVCTLLSGCAHIEGTILSEEAVMTDLPAGQERESVKSVDNIKYAMYSDHAEMIGFDPLFRQTDYSFPEEVEGLPLTALSNIKGFTPSTLTSVRIPEGVVSIGEGTFKNCKTLKTVHFSASVSHIGAEAFQGTAWLQEQQSEDPFVVVNSILIDGKRVRDTAVIPNGVTYIADDAFHGNTSITEAVIPGSVYRIGKKAFSGCSNLTKVTFGMNAALRQIDERAFTGTEMASLRLPSKLETIGNYAFCSCDKLEYADLPGSLTTLGFNAFSGCTALQEIELPMRVDTIGNSCFLSCTSLKSICIFNKDCSIGRNCFSFTSSDVMIYGQENSTAQAYAAANSLQFTAY